MKKVCLFICLITLFGCGVDRMRPTITPNNEVSYADGFLMERRSGYTIIEVINPWDTLTLLNRYILVDKDLEVLPDSMPDGVVIRVPIDRAVVYNSVDCGMWWSMDVLPKIVGVCEPEYISIDYIKKGIDNGTIKNLGQVVMPNSELIISSNPDIIVASPFQNKSYGSVEKLGIPIIESAGYMENSPLARAEWIKFHAAFLGKSCFADSLFYDIEQKYNEISALTKNCKERPSVLAEKRYGQVWYIPGGNSYAALIYKDAGADYMWEEDNSTGSLAYSFEAIYDKAADADVWIIKYNNPTSDMTLKSLKSEYESYKMFNAYKMGAVYACNTAQGSYYEETTLRPDLVLADMIKIFHPDLMPNHEIRYYKKIE